MKKICKKYAKICTICNLCKLWHQYAKYAPRTRWERGWDFKFASWAAPQDTGQLEQEVWEDAITGKVSETDSTA